VVRFLADMGISRTVVRAMQDLGHDAIHLLDEGLQHLPDAHVVEKAKSEERVVLTHDLDFARLLVAADESKPSAITFRLSNMRPENVLAHLLEVLEQFPDELHGGAIVSVGDTTSRCRLLPIQPAE